MAAVQKILDGYCPLPTARLSHLRKPRSISVHGRQLYLCQYTGELGPKAYGVSVYGVRQGSFRDMGCLLSFLVSCINNDKTIAKEKELALELYQDIFKTLSLESQQVPVAPSPMDLARFGGTQLRLDDKYTYHIPEMTPNEESKWLFNPDIHTEHDEKPKEPRIEIQVPMDFEGDYFVVEHREANLRTLRSQLQSFLEEHNTDIENSMISFKNTPNIDDSQFALSFLNKEGKTADFIIRPYSIPKPSRKPPVPKKKQPVEDKQAKKDRKAALKKMDKEQDKTMVQEILADSNAMKLDAAPKVVVAAQVTVPAVAEVGKETAEKIKKTTRKTVKRMAEEIEDQLTQKKTKPERKKKLIPSVKKEEHEIVIDLAV